MYKCWNFNAKRLDPMIWCKKESSIRESAVPVMEDRIKRKEDDLVGWFMK
jgi:hypothetical protein